MQLSLQLDSRVWRRNHACGRAFRPPSLNRERRPIARRGGSLTQAVTPGTGANLDFGMTTNMLKILTKKFKSQSLSEGNGNYHAEVSVSPL